MTETSVLSAPTDRAQGRWERRPLLAKAVRGVVFLVPVVSSTVVAFALASVLPNAPGAEGRVAKAVALVAIALLVARLVRPLATRLLPVSALLELTLVFPDQAPSRMKTALRTRSEDELADLVEVTRARGLPGDAEEAAAVILELVVELSRHDRITRGHSERVRVYSSMLAREMGLSEDEIGRLGWAGLIHDIGKLTIAAEILNKPTRLTEDEYEIVKGHAVAGAAMVEPLRPWLGDVVDAVGQHHERWDGNGYPNGLAGEQISLAARIISVADVFDVITALRSYKKPASPAEARRELAANAGTQFDPKVVRAFLSLSVANPRLGVTPLAAIAQVPLIQSTLAVPGALAVPTVGSAATSVVVAAAAITGPSLALSDGLVWRADPSVERHAAAAAQDTESAAPEHQAVAAASRPAASDEKGEAKSAESMASSPQNLVQTEHERELAEAEAEAQAEHVAIDAKMRQDLARIDVRHAEDDAKANAEYQASIAAADEAHAEDMADLEEDRAQRDEKLRQIDEDLEEELADLKEERDEEMAELDEEYAEAEDAEERQEVEEDRAQVQREYDEDVADAKAKAQEDRQNARQKVAEKEREAQDDHERAVREAEQKRAERLDKHEREYNEDRAEVRGHAQKKHAEVDEDLQQELERLRRDHENSQAS